MPPDTQTTFDSPTDTPPGPDETDAPALFPAAPRALALRRDELNAGGIGTLPVTLSNPQHYVLHIRLASSVSWLIPIPDEVALGPGERQDITLRVDRDAAARVAADPSADLLNNAAVRIAYQPLYPAARGVGPGPAAQGEIFVRLPIAVCPSCQRSLGDAWNDDSGQFPDSCPFCFERLRPCPVCAAPCSWLQTHCPVSPEHPVRTEPPWPTLGGSATHTGTRPGTATPPALSRRWSFPSVAPARRENALTWSAPVAAWGVASATAATTEGDAHVYAFDLQTGAPLWEPFPLPEPVYPERGGAALAISEQDGGRMGCLFLATIEGVCFCLDALRGTRLWETPLENARVYGGVLPANDVLLVPAVTGVDSGCLFVLDKASGSVRWQVPLPGLTDTAPAADLPRKIAYTHDDSGALTAIEWSSGKILWSTRHDSGFDAAPVLWSDMIFSATTAGQVWCRRADTGEEVWHLAVTNSALGGTPATDGALLYVPADDGVHVLSTAGRPVRRYGLQRPVRAAPLILGGTLYFGATDGHFYGAGAGRPLQSVYETGTGSQFVAAPACDSGIVLAAATNGVLYALNTPLARIASAPVKESPDQNGV